jgi:hypothetical protein
MTVHNEVKARENQHHPAEKTTQNQQGRGPRSGKSFHRQPQGSEIENSQSYPYDQRDQESEHVLRHIGTPFS